MANMAQDLTLDTIPPQVRFTLLSDTSPTWSRMVDTPCQIARRVHPDPGEIVLRVRASAVDYNGRTCTYTWATLHGDDTMVTVTPTATDGSEAEIRFRPFSTIAYWEDFILPWRLPLLSPVAAVGCFANNGLATSAPSYITATSVVASEQAPSPLNAPGTLNIPVGGSATFTVNFNSLGADSPYEIKSMDEFLLPRSGIRFARLSSTQAQVTVEPRPGLAGSVMLWLGQQGITVNVVAANGNTPPIISASVNQVNIIEDGVSDPIVLTLDDAQTSVDDLTVTAVSSCPQIIPPENISITGSGSSRTMVITPKAGRCGRVAIRLLVSDGAASSVTTVMAGIAGGTFRWTGADAISTDYEPNDPPLITGLGSRSAASGGAVAPVDVRIDDVDSDVGRCTVTAISSNQTLLPNSGLGVAFGYSEWDRRINIAPAPGQTGTATVTVTATDRSGASTSGTFTVTIGAGGNMPPSIGAPAVADPSSTVLP